MGLTTKWKVRSGKSWVSTFWFGVFFFFQAEDGIRDLTVTGVQTCALPICTQAVGGACAKASKEPGAAGAGCDAARSLRARVKSDWASAGNFSFHGFRKTDVAPQTWAACDAAGASDQGAAAGDWCRLERARRNGPGARCAMVQAELGDVCYAMTAK